MLAWRDNYMNAILNDFEPKTHEDTFRIAYELAGVSENVTYASIRHYFDELLYYADLKPLEISEIIIKKNLIKRTPKKNWNL
jgi:hypothetical protein